MLACLHKEPHYAHTRNRCVNGKRQCRVQAISRQVGRFDVWRPRATFGDCCVVGFTQQPQQQQQISHYFNPTYTRTGWIGQPPVLDRHEVVTIDGDVVTLRQATP